jgi:N6-L-threonylcarbamoyladenine synthase
MTTILGIESSCDETAAAVVVDGWRILSNVVASQNDVHRKYGGVVPELASREHLRQIVPVVREALERAGLSFGDVDGIGVTQGPGLVGSLLVGITYARVLARSLQKPLLAVNHLEGHVHAALLEARRSGRRPQFPAVCLIVSGGHTLLYEVTRAGRDAGEAGEAVEAVLPLHYLRLGGTRDDAAGEAYDKVAKLLALGYPGGPILDQLAAPASVEREPGARSGNPQAIHFAPSKMKGNALDFSFSGIKTAVLYYVREHPELEAEVETRRAELRGGDRGAGGVRVAEIRKLCSQHTLDLVASFQRAVVSELVGRTVAAAEKCKVGTILVSGGVAANRELRERFAGEAARRAWQILFPAPELSTDNAAMIAAAAFAHLHSGQLAGTEVEAEPNLRLG